MLEGMSTHHVASARPAAAAVIFDLDGTLVDSEPAYYEAGRRTLAEYGVHDFGWEQHTRFIGVGTRETLAALRTEYRIEAPVDELLAVKNRHYLRLVRSATEVFPEMRKFVELLHTAGMPMAVASGSSRSAIGAALAASGLDALLTTYVSAEDVGRSKPDPAVFVAAARRLGVRPADCVVVEDSAPGVAAARRARMACIAVPYLPDAAGDPVLASAGLLFPGGQREFDAQAAYDWAVGGHRPTRPLR
jgi:HAD superfamily hydrolase (TIGR01509 family)